jgi:membrane-bound lytic murein transglycosylase F
MYSRFFPVILFFSVFFSFCSAPGKQGTGSERKSQEKRFPEKVDLLDTILKTKKLKVTTNFSSTDYFIYKGIPMGYQYEMATRFARYLGVKLEMNIERRLPRSFELLDSLKTDILTMGLTVTADRKEKVLFTKPILFTRQVLVQRKPHGWQKMRTADEIESHLLRNVLELSKKKIYVHKGTVFVERLKNMMNEIGDTIYVIEDDRETEELIKAVAEGEIDYTVSDEYMALVDASFYRNIDVKTYISFPQKVAWAVRKDQKRLRDTINVWLNKFYKTIDSRVLYNKYFKNISRRKSIKKSDYNSYGKGELSPYDKTIKEAAKILNWDWKLLASLIYQESEFKPSAHSWVGAKGLMQMMPDVLKKYGLTEKSPPEKQIMAGAKYLKYLEKQIPPEVTDSVERIKFTLASYNTGVGHVLDARRLAKKYGKDPNIWTDNVDYFILHLSEKKYYNDPVVYYGYVRGWETYNFVSDIMERYKIYKALIK